MSLLFFIESGAQVYSYEIPGSSNFEFNPAALASGKFKFNSSLAHQGSPFSKDKFYYDNLRVGLYNKDVFAGAGISLNRTSLNDTTSYISAGLGAAYRVVMFDKVFTRIGLMYKFISSESPNGVFAYHEFKADSVYGIKKHQQGNFNFSISFSSANNRAFITFGALNYSVRQNSDANILFPSYYYVQVGDLTRSVGIRRLQTNYLCQINQGKNSALYNINHYLNFQHQSFAISRRSGVNLGTRLGWNGDAIYHASPFISYNNWDNKRNFNLQLMVDMMFDGAKTKMNFPPTAQLSLIYEY